MSIEAVTWALGVNVGDSTRKLVLIGYANHAHRDGQNSWAAKDTIAEYANCHVKTVRRHVQTLIAEGWMREGDQQQVAHLRADRRPVVYDVAMTEATRRAWAAEQDLVEPPEPPLLRGDSVSPREDERGDTALSPGEPAHGGTHGGTQLCPSRGDTAVSPEPSMNQELPPNPPPSGGPTSSTSACAKPGPTPHVNCRGCGTTNRQLADQRRRDAAERARAAEQRRLEAERARAAATSRPAAEVPDRIASIRRTLLTARSTA